MNLHLYDSSSGEIRRLQQREAGKVSIYACGPTVYDLPHIGHGRMVLVYDILRRYLESRGIDVTLVFNVTDIDDKIINRANAEGRSTEEIVTEYEAAFWSALDNLNVAPPRYAPHATEYVDKMVTLVGELIENGFAYETSDTVYFDPGKVPGYGLLARQSVDSLLSGARVDADEHKRSPIDFALWKKAKPGEPSWPSPWGAGRPGWHTECVVMSLDLLGDRFDLHAGGQDLMFPHHENERAQAVALGNEFARHWMHNGFVEMSGEKMSKSVGNFVTLTDMLGRTDPRAFRLLVLRAHYRSPMEVTPESIADAESAMSRLDDFARRFREISDGEVEGNSLDVFNTHMDNDLDTPQAVAEMFALVRQANTEADDGDEQSAAKKARTVMEMAATLGLQLQTGSGARDERTAELIRRRDQARADRNWSQADDLRAELQAMGWTVEDGSGGTQVHR